MLGGLRFDNQQWQDEHGLGLSTIGIEKVEVIKGPASLLYGSEAMGGVINIIEEKPEAQGKSLDAGAQLYSNTRGYLTDVGYSNKLNNTWWKIRAGIESNADYSDGNNTRVLNSRNKGYFIKAGFGFDKPKWMQELNYTFSYNQFGFIVEDLNDFIKPDANWSRSMAGPHHNVMLNLLGSQNTFTLKSSVLKLNIGLQSNLRQEDEGGGQISLNMHLFSALQNLRWEKVFKRNINFVLNQQFTYTNNKNFGSRVIVPDANLLEGNMSGYFKFNLKKILFEAGAGTNYKYIQTFQTKNLNSAQSETEPFKKNNFTVNGMAGIVYNPDQNFTLKANIASGFRAPNLAELSSNGLHEGSYRYEIGDPDLKTEQNINGDISAEFSSKLLFFSVSAFNNKIYDYVYLAPTSEIYYGFQVFRYRQQNARLYGGEFTSRIQFLRGLYWNSTLSFVRGKLEKDLNLPFIPAPKISTGIRFEKNLSDNKKIYAEPEFNYFFRQSHVAQFETVTNSYVLFNFSAGVNLPATKGNWIISFNVKNVTNTLYADHLSRLKYYDLNNQGKDFVLSVRRTLSW